MRKTMFGAFFLGALGCGSVVAQIQNSATLNPKDLRRYLLSYRTRVQLFLRADPGF